MKRMLLIFGMIFLIVPLFAQRQPWVHEKVNIKFQLKVEQDSFALYTIEQTVESTISDQPLVQSAKLSLHQTDIHIDYRLWKDSRKLYHHINFRLLAETGEEILLIPAYKIKGDKERINKKKRFPNRSIWKDAIEQMLIPGKIYILQLETSLYGELGFECSEGKPVMKTGHLLPPVVLSAVGGAFILIGDNLLHEANKNNNTYKEKWKEGLSQGDTNSFLEKADEQNTEGSDWQKVGVGVLSVGGGLLAWRLYKHRQMVKRYHKYCTDRAQLSISPSGTSEGTGLKLSLTF